MSFLLYTVNTCNTNFPSHGFISPLGSRVKMSTEVTSISTPGINFTSTYNCNIITARRVVSIIHYLNLEITTGCFGNTGFKT